MYGRAFWLAYASNLALLVALSLMYRYADFIRLINGDEFDLGAIVGVGMVGSLLARFAIGASIDRRGVRLVWLASSAIFTVLCLLHLALSSAHGPLIYLHRLVFCCAMAGIFGASMTFVASLAPPRRTAELVGMLGTSSFVGMMLGNLLGDAFLPGELLDWDGIRWMFLGAAALGALSTALAALATRGVRRPAPARHPPVWAVFRRHNPGVVLAVGVGLGAGVVFLQTFLRTYLQELGIGGMGLFFSVYAASAVVTRVVTRRWVERYGARRMIFLGMGGLALAQLLMLSVTAEWRLCIPALAFGIAHAMLFPSVVAAGTLGFPECHRGLATTVVLATWDVGLMIGAPLQGAILHFSGKVGLSPYPALFCATALLLLGTLAWYAWERRQPPIHAARAAEKAEPRREKVGCIT